MDITRAADMLRASMSSLRDRIERSFPSLRRDMQLIVTGLYGAGKSTMLSQLHLGEVQQLRVAIDFTVECIWHEKVSIRSWDVGGTAKIRPLYRHFFDGAQAVLFAVDCGDREQLPHAKREIDRLMAEPELAEARLVVLGIDKQCGAARAADTLTLHQLMQVLDLDAATMRDCGAFRVELGPPSDGASTANGVWEAFEWLEKRMHLGGRKPTRRWLRGTSGYDWSDRTYGASSVPI